MTPRRTWFSVAATLCLAVFAVACTDLSAVREWSSTSLEATQYNEVVATYADTPQRLKRYDPDGPWDAEAAVRASQAEALKELLSLVSDYMAALATLSADGAFDYRKDVEALGDSLEALNASSPGGQVIVSSETLGAATSLVGTLLNAATEAYQSRQVALIVEQANDPLQEILRGELREIVDQDFRRDLRIERASLDRYYSTPLERETHSRAASIALQEWEEVRLQRNREREMALDAYLLVLDKVAEGHQKLYDNRNRLDSKTLISELLSLAVSLRKQIKILATA